MAKAKDIEKEEVVTKVSPNDLGWNDYVLGLLSDDEKIDGNPTVDGLRRVFEIALNCCVLEARSEVVQTPEPNNEKRATVVHTIIFVLKDLDSNDDQLKYRSVSGAADVYWGNCDKIYRNHPVAVAETRAEGRALRRALRLRKVVAAEELANSIEDDINHESVGKITSNQINFIDIIAKRLNINVMKLLANLGVVGDNIHTMLHEDALKAIRELSKHQQSLENIPQNILGYDSSWR
jgi:hypothetical protein